MNKNRISGFTLAVSVAAVVLSPSLLVAQDPPSQVPQTPAPGSLGAPGETGQQMQDKLFVQKATQGGIAQIQLAKLAVQKGSPDVKDFAQKMIDDHTAINKDMATVADEIGTMLPRKMSKDDQAEYDKLNALSGDAFDKEYILYVAKGHREDMRDFRMEVTAAADQGLQAEVAKAAGIIRNHLMMIAKLAKDKGVELPARPAHPPTAPPAL
jgi:putative membrane protein